MTQVPAIQDLLPLLPELVLACGAMVMLMVGAMIGERSSAIVNGWCVIILALAAAVLLWLPRGPHVMFGGSFLVDDYARFLKMLTLVGSGGALLLSLDYLTLEKQQKFEYGTLFLLATLGMLMLISASDLIALYLGLELMSLPLYVIAASNREDTKSTEAGLKYFVLGALSSGMLLYGASLIYGFTGTVNFAGIAKATQSGASIGLIFGLVFLFVGFCFKISAVPFHMWTPDVYEGAPTPVTAFFAAAPKVAAIAIFARATVVAFPGITHQWQQIVVFVSIASMALGAFAAIGQRNIKRLMAYSSIGHMGYALVGLAAGTPEGVQGVSGLYEHLRGDDARHVRRNSVDAPRGQISGEHRRSRRARAYTSDHGLFPGGAIIFAGRYSATRWLLREILRVPRRYQGRAFYPCGHRRAQQRGGRLLLSRDRQDHVFRRAGKRLRTHADTFAAGPGSLRSGQHTVFCLPGAASWCGNRGSEILVLNGPRSHGPSGGPAHSPTRRSDRPTPRRCRVRAPANAGRCGSQQKPRPPAAVVAAANGFRRQAIFTRPFC